MNIVIFSPNLKAKTGSPIRAFNIISGLYNYGVNYNIALVSSNFEDELLEKYRCYSINNYSGIEGALISAVQENNADVLLCITHGYANIVSKVARRFGIPFFVDIHGIRTLEILEERINLITKIKNIYGCFPWFIGVIKATKVFCANPNLYKWLRLFFRNKVVNICGITDVSKFKFIQKDGSDIKVLYAGNFNSYQGVELLLDAIKIIGDDSAFKFYIAGNNNITDKNLESKISELKSFRNFFFIPPISYEEYPDFLSKMDVFVVPRKPSITAYMAFPQKIIESMSSGKCVIATNLSPHKIAFTNPDCGILCDPNPGSISNAIIKTKDSKLRLSLGKAARKKALENYDLSVQIPKIIKNIEDSLI